MLPPHQIYHLALPSAWQVINASQAPAVFRSPNMFARKVDPDVDPGTVRLWDEWMGKKLKGWAPADQEQMGVRRGGISLPPLERGVASVARSSTSGGLPRKRAPRGRKVGQVGCYASCLSVRLDRDLGTKRYASGRAANVREVLSRGIRRREA